MQLYSLRDYVDNDIMWTLEKIKEAGFDGIELAGEHGVPANVLKVKLFELGLEPMGAHVNFQRLEERLDEAVDFCVELGVNCVFCPGTDLSDIDKINHAVEVFKIAGERFAEKGIQFGFHCHHREFATIDNRYILDILYEKMPAELFTFELDTFWVRRGNEDPAKIANQYADRIYVLHAKDMYEDGKDSTVGGGCIDFEAVMSNLHNLKWVVIEQEGFEGDPFEEIANGCANMKKVYEKINRR